ncbi:MAG: PKD domain-containing protein [Candidatus Bathyarchaeota archaeon]|nr:PKD domain-containing protein [Candidatus Bathyarchaeota archaeon]
MENYGFRTFSYSWNFGDNTSATSATVNHIFTNPGTYTVALTVLDNLGFRGIFEQSIEVREQTPLIVYISLSSASIYTG